MARGTWQGGGTWQTSGGGGVVLVVVIAALAIGSGAVTAAVSALVTIVLIVTGAVVGLAVLGGIALLVYRARQRPPEIRNGVTDLEGAPGLKLPTGVGNSAPEILTDPDRPAIGPGREVHYHFHVSAAELAAIMRDHAGEE